MILKWFFTKVLEKHIRRRTSRTDSLRIAGLGVLSDLSDENYCILYMTEKEFETIVPDDIAGLQLKCCGVSNYLCSKLPREEYPCRKTFLSVDPVPEEVLEVCEKEKTNRRNQQH